MRKRRVAPRRTSARSTSGHRWMIDRWLTVCLCAAALRACVRCVCSRRRRGWRLRSACASTTCRRASPSTSRACGAQSIPHDTHDTRHAHHRTHHHTHARTTRAFSADRHTRHNTRRRIRLYGSGRGLDVGLSLAVAIIIHVIPEGMAIAAPIYHSTGRCTERTHDAHARHDTQG